MGSLFNTLHNVSDSMAAFQKGLQVTGNNVTNASTPGYVRQRLSLESRPLEIQGGLAGGVYAGTLISSRRAYLERGVYTEAQREGRYAQLAFSLEQVEPVFDISQNSGVAGAIDGLFRSFSQLSVSPNDIPVRESVVRGAQTLANAFNFTAAALGSAAGNAEVEIRSVVSAINRIGARVQELNVQIRNDARRLQDPGLDAQIHAALEELAEYVDFTVLRGDDGSFNIFTGGQTPLVIGDKFYELGAEFSNGGATILDFAGRDIGSQFEQGRIRGLLDLRNDFIPSLMSDLDRLAEGVADAVNGQLVTGVDLSGQPPSRDLFTYDPALGAAGTIKVTDITPDQLAAAVPGAPGGNGNALQLAAIGRSPRIDDFSFSQFFGSIASQVGRALSSARGDQETHSLLLSQARSIRAEASEVNLDEEAANLIAFQRAYQASAELIRVVNSLTEETINILR